MFTQHTPSNELPCTTKFVQYKACCPQFSQHLPKKGAPYSTINNQGEGAVRPQQMQINKEKGYSKKEAI